MNNCLECTRLTTNPKFCNKSCAARYNNRKFPKRGNGLGRVCPSCGGIKNWASKNCQLCWNTKKSQTDVKLSCVCVKCKRQYVYTVPNGHGKLKCNSCLCNAHRERKMRKCLDWLGGCCERCGYDRSTRALCFHHKDPETKSFPLTICSMTRKMEILLEEVEKCVLLCANCHMELHDQVWSSEED